MFMTSHGFLLACPSIFIDLSVPSFFSFFFFFFFIWFADGIRIRTNLAQQQQQDVRVNGARAHSTTSSASSGGASFLQFQEGTQEISFHLRTDLERISHPTTAPRSLFQSRAVSLQQQQQQRSFTSEPELGKEAETPEEYVLERTGGALHLIADVPMQDYGGIENTYDFLKSRGLVNQSTLPEDALRKHLSTPRVGFRVD